MEIVKYEYNNQMVEFEVMNKEVMVNATEMAKIFGKEVSGFLKTEQTENFIKAFCQTENIPFGDEFLPSGKLIKIVKGDLSVRGTWMHRTVALKFAAWLDPFFEVWVYKIIDKLLYGNYLKLINEFVEIQKGKVAIKKVTNRLRNNDDFLELQTLKARQTNLNKMVKSFNADLKELEM